MKMRRWLSALLCASMVLAMPVSVSAEEASQDDSVTAEAVQEENTDAQNPADAEETAQPEESAKDVQEESAPEEESAGKEDATSEDETQAGDATSGANSDDVKAHDNADSKENEAEAAAAEDKNEPSVQSESKAARAAAPKVSGPKESENNNTQSMADTIQPNQSVNGSISSRDDVDWYKVTLNSNCYISLTLSHSYIDEGSECWTVNFYNADNSVTYKMTLTGEETSKRSCRLGLPKGTYYIQVSDGTWVYSSINYNLRVNYVAADYWETENNDTVSSADSIAPNTSVTGSLPKSGDNDYYKFTLGSNGYISLTLNHTYIDSVGSYWKVRLFRGTDGSLLEEFDYQGNIASQRSCRIGLPKGTYYVEVLRGGSYSDIDYNLRVNYVAATHWETEVNNSFGTADTISPNVSVTGSLMASDDNDYYKFTTGSDGYISLTLNHSFIDSGSDYWRVRLYRGSDSTLIEEFFYQGNIASQKSCRVGLPKGTYYLQVSDDNRHSTVDYNLRVNYVVDKSYETEINDSIGSADTITKYSTSRGTLMTSDDQDYYTFSLAAKCYVNFRLTHGYVDNSRSMFSLTVSDRNNSPVFEYSLTGQQTGTNKGIVLPAGKYYIKISSDRAHSTTPYGLVVEPVTK